MACCPLLQKIIGIRPSVCKSKQKSSCPIDFNYKCIFVNSLFFSLLLQTDKVNYFRGKSLHTEYVDFTNIHPLLVKVHKLYRNATKKARAKQCHAFQQSKRESHLEDNLVVWSWGPSNPECKFTRISFHVLSNTQFRGLQSEQSI